MPVAQLGRYISQLKAEAEQFSSVLSFKTKKKQKTQLYACRDACYYDLYKYRVPPYCMVGTP